jgi:hypothetical protein
VYSPWRELGVKRGGKRGAKRRGGDVRQTRAYVFAPEPVLSLRRISISMCLILIRTSRKKILPTTTSLRWYLDF